MSSIKNPEREILRHLVATIAFRCGIGITDVPESFAEFRAAESTRTAGEILAHIGDLIEGSLFLLKGELIYLQSAPQLWNKEVARFFIAVRELDLFLASEEQLAQSVEKMLQGPIADALTHIGQIIMLRRMAGKPIGEKSYFTAEIVAGNIDEKYFTK